MSSSIDPIRTGPAEQREHGEQADGEQRQPREEQEPAWGEQQEETEVPPTVAPGAEVRLASATVRAEDRRHFPDVEALERCPDDHLAGELHARGAEIEIDDRLASEATHAAVEVSDVDIEQSATDERERRVTDDPVQRRHRPRGDAAAEAVADHEVGAVAQRIDEGRQIVECVAVVGVGHDHQVGAAALDPARSAEP